MKIGIHITPNSSKDEIVGRFADGRYRVRIQSPPIDGLANKRLITFIAKTVGVSKSSVRIVRGVKSRDKIIEIVGDEKEIIHRMKG